MLSFMILSLLAGGTPAPISAAQGVLQRTVGSAVSGFELSLLPAREDKLDSFTIEAQGGKVRVAGTSAVAICRGAYEYLRDACHCQVNWSGSNVRLPKALPDYAKREVVTPNRYRHYYNICTFGYSAVWWDWKRWEREIDWMALHGINMPLAMNGQEKVWQKVFRDLGLPDASLAKFFSGPAFLPWHWMGNLNGHGGPLPQSWIDGQASLQKRILGRERSLGMTPIVPGFSGFVPTDFSTYHPEVKLSSPEPWCGFPATTFVDVRNPMFVEIGKRFVRQYRKEFGSDHLYLCDTFNEQNPTFPKETEMADLAACGKAVTESIRQGDPDGVWVTQGWFMANSPDYWTVPRVDALFRDVPEDRLVVLDLATSWGPVWKRQPSVRQRGWIYNTLPNFGENTHLSGALQYSADRAAQDLNDPNHGRMLGMGLTMEGIEENPVVYELLTDAMWRRDRIDVAKWLPSYAWSRYGRNLDTARAAWSYLLPAAYSQDLISTHEGWRVRPSLDAAPSHYQPVPFRFAATMLDSSVVSGQSDPLLERDLVDVTKTWLSALAENHLVAAINSFDTDRPAYEKHKASFFALLHDIDRVMAVRPEHRLSSWIHDARQWGANAAERDLMERNARMQITIWGGPELYDYAHKEWAGLIDDFFVPRWGLMFDTLERAGSTKGFKAPDFAAWEEAWTRRTEPPKESKPELVGPLVRELISRYGGDNGDVARMLGIDSDPGIAVGAKVVTSAGVEGDHRPEFVVDGARTGGYWAASPAPQWVQIDLGRSRQTTGVRLFPYYGDGRVYTYKVELSEDGQTWKTEVDASNNEQPASFRGYGHTWPAVPARYVKVTMLHNSANVGVHLYEVRVLGGRD